MHPKKGPEMENDTELSPRAVQPIETNTHPSSHPKDLRLLRARSIQQGISVNVHQKSIIISPPLSLFSSSS